MVHMFSFDSLAAVAFVYVVEIWSSEHAEEEIDMNEWDGNVGSG